MNENTNSIAGSLTRHTLTAGGVAGLVNAQDDLLKLASLILTAIGLAWSIWEKISRNRQTSPTSPTAPDVLPLPLLLGLCVPLCFAGCRGLDPAGVYAGDQFLHASELTIVTSYDVTRQFLKWEKANRVALERWPEIRRTADLLRTEYPAWHTAAVALHDVYKGDPSTANRSRFETALAMLQSALNQAAAMLATDYTNLKPAQPALW